MTASKYLNTVLTVIAVLLGLNLWTGMHTSPAGESLDPATTAHAQGRANPAEERREIINKLNEVVASVDAVGSKLDAMTNRSGQVRVEIESMPDGD
ncbi:MAG: hypothetical protein ACIAXF_03540 [Phycisphaerales bacterium JB063]